ncbi:hypothetical protein F0562_026287 [Nyssa sinensis]|uniref:Protein kinase domain-containing protein n=1 Tax=Nyssa sinensis TaxID=561372 RepID=A0A5J5B8M2_9ASTE|nr:hypothetical protein F0562_026287 [Nyssa sinensis]
MHEFPVVIVIEQTSSIGIRGSVGYTAPEYGMGSEVSTSGDVYSYGILLLEMFTGKRPTDEMFSDGLSLHNYVKMALPERVEVIADPILIQQGEEEGQSSWNGWNTWREKKYNYSSIMSWCSI